MKSPASVALGEDSEDEQWCSNGEETEVWKETHLTPDPGYGSGLGSKRAFTLETQNDTAIGCL